MFLIFWMADIILKQKLHLEIREKSVNLISNISALTTLICSWSFPLWPYATKIESTAATWERLNLGFVQMMVLKVYQKKNVMPLITHIQSDVKRLSQRRRVAAVAQEASVWGFTMLMLGLLYQAVLRIVIKDMFNFYKGTLLEKKG